MTTRKTVLYERHVELGARIVDFHGWMLPVQYAGILSERDRCRTAAAVFDTCHMGQIRIEGPDAARALSRVLTQNAATLAIGRCRYGFLLNESGGILDDTVLLRLARDEFLLVVNAATREGDVRWLRAHLGGDAALEDRSTRWGKIDLQGPASHDVLKGLVDFDLASLGFFHGRAGQCCGSPGIVTRTGYTGELGYELLLPSEAVPGCFDRLLSHEAVAPAGLGARDMLRLEVGYPLYGQDLSEERNPIEADLGRFLELDREFIGAEALRGTAASGPERILVAFRADTRRRTDAGQTILAGDDPVGEVTSAGFSPAAGASIGLGYVKPGYAAPGTALGVAHSKGVIPVTVAEKPVYRGGTCRTTQLAWEARR